MNDATVKITMTVGYHNRGIARRRRMANRDVFVWTKNKKRRRWICISAVSDVKLSAPVGTRMFAK